MPLRVVDANDQCGPNVGVSPGILSCRVCRPAFVEVFRLVGNDSCDFLGLASFGCFLSEPGKAVLWTTSQIGERKRREKSLGPDG
jgi:hypothetical protein